MLISATTPNDLRKMLYKQLESFFLLGEEERALIDSHIESALSKLEFSFSRTKNKYYHDESIVRFDPLHGCQWARFLYELSRSVYLSGESVSVCDKIYGLLKVMASADLFYQVELPDVRSSFGRNNGSCVLFQLLHILPRLYCWQQQRCIPRIRRIGLYAVEQ